MTEFRKVANADEIPQGTVKRVDIDDQDLELLIAHIDDNYFAFDNVCKCVPHFAGHPDATGENVDHHTHGDHLVRLEHGEVDGETITCPAHTTVYNMRTGRPLRGPGEIPLSTYETKLEDNAVHVAVMSDSRRHFWNDPGHKNRP